MSKEEEAYNARMWRMYLDERRRGIIDEYTSLRQQAERDGFYIIPIEEYIANHPVEEYAPVSAGALED